MIGKRYAALEPVIADLEQRLRGSRVKWTDKTGPHNGSWEAFRGAVFFPLIGRMEPMNPEDCPLLEFDMNQLEKLDTAAQMGMGVLFHWIGFPAMELKGNVWENRHGLVRLEDSQEWA